MPRYPQRRYPGIMAQMLLLHEPTELRKARGEANTYQRKSLRQAFDSGWYAQARSMPREFADTNPLLSRMARPAWRAGWDARQAYDQPKATEGST